MVLKPIRVEEAVDLALRAIKNIKLDVEEVNVLNAQGRVLAEDVFASINNPPFSRSYLDGFAVYSEDTLGASPFNPVILKIVGKVDVTGGKPVSPKRGEAVEVSTGAPIPPGLDAVVPYEDVKVLEGFIEVYRPVAKFSNIARVGEDYKVGDLLLPKNKLLKPWDLAIVASMGLSRVKVLSKLKIGVLCTGSEVVEPAFELRDGFIYNSTCVLVKNYFDQTGFIEARYYGVVPDDYEVLRKTILRIIEENHVALVSGGAGFSTKDVSSMVLNELGTWVFRGVAIRPGKPTSLAIVNDKPVFLLSGFPVAAWVALESIVSEVLFKLLKIESPLKPGVKAILKRKLPNVVGYRSFVRVKLEWRGDGVYAEPYVVKGSGVLSSLVRSDGYVVVPEDSEGFDEGEVVSVILM